MSGISLNTNMAALTVQRHLKQSAGALGVSMQRLSSGLRVNSAKDDAAGLAIAERMRSQTQGLAVAARNANDGISLAQTAEGALGKTGSMLQRIRELAVQSANATNSQSDRDALQAEAHQMLQEIDRVARTTQFNGKKLLDGSFTAAIFQVGANAGDILAIGQLGNTTTAQLGSVKFGASSSPLIHESQIGLYMEPIEVGALRIRVGAGEEIALGAITAASSGKERLGQVVSAINAQSSATGLTAYLVTADQPNTYRIDLRSSSDQTISLAGFTDAYTGVGRSLTTSYTGNDLGNITEAKDRFMATLPLQSLGTTQGSSITLDDMKYLRRRIDPLAGGTDILASERYLFTNDGPRQQRYGGTFWDRYVVPITEELNIPPVGGIDPTDWWTSGAGWDQASRFSVVHGAVQALQHDFLRAVTAVQHTRMAGVEQAFANAAAGGAGQAASSIVALESALAAVGITTPLNITADLATDPKEALQQAMGNARFLSEGGFGIAAFNVQEHIGVENLDISTQSGAWEALVRVDKALDQVNSSRAQLGALQTRFESIVSNIGSMHENLSAARGRIVDADYAMETAQLSRAQILQQAGTAILAQANQLPQQILQLLR